eukprot:228178_1
MTLFLFTLLCVAISKRVPKHNKIECVGFETQQCVDLLFEYYGLTMEELSAYGPHQQAWLAESIECHYIYDVCPFYVPPITGEKLECENGRVEFIEDEETGDKNYYQCKDVDLLSFIPIEHLGSNNNASGADIWGFQTVGILGNVNKHYAITSQADGSTIVDVTDPINPNVLAFITSNVDGALRNVLWRDVKVFKEWAIVVADTGGINDHGIQIYNLREIISAAENFQSTFKNNNNNNNRKPIYNVPKNDIIIYEGVGRCHNVYVDNDIGHLYAMGSAGKNGIQCGSGLHIINIENPTQPTFMGCYDSARYVHDAQCVIYHGPDSDYTGHEICFMFTPDIGDLTIIDITNPISIFEISRTPYFTSSYNHQGWVTSNHEYLLLDDETDEGPLPDRFPRTQDTTTTYIFDIRDLDNIDYRRAHHSHIRVVDHNQYIIDNGHLYSSASALFRGYTFQANYEGGLRILSIDKIANENQNILEEIAYFDVYPWDVDENGDHVHDNIQFFGAWSVYPYFNKLGTNPNDYIYSNKLIVQSTTTGLYVLQFNGNMDFSTPVVAADIDGHGHAVDEGNNDGFKLNKWYGIIFILLGSMLILLAIITLFVWWRKQKEKRIGVYESIVAMETSNKTYGTKHVDTDNNQRL